MIYASFSLVDAFVLIIVLAVIAAVIFFGFVKKSKDGGCKGCPYAKECPRTDEEKKKVKKRRLHSCGKDCNDRQGGSSGTPEKPEELKPSGGDGQKK